MAGGFGQTRKRSEPGRIDKPGEMRRVIQSLNGVFPVWTGPEPYDAARIQFRIDLADIPGRQAKKPENKVERRTAVAYDKVKARRKILLPEP